MLIYHSAPQLIPIHFLFRNVRPNGRNPDHSIIQKLLSELQLHPLAWAFLQPVPTDEVTDYLEVIKQPMGKSSLLL